jgi:hypothetical protein
LVRVPAAGRGSGRQPACAQRGSSSPSVPVSTLPLLPPPAAPRHACMPRTDVLAAALVPEGYSCFFRAKQPSPAMKFGFPADGIALFYRHSRFSCNPAPTGARVVAAQQPRMVGRRCVACSVVARTRSSARRGADGRPACRTACRRHTLTHTLARARACARAQGTALRPPTGSLRRRAL